MSDTAIKFENISKQYRLGQIGTGTLSHDLNRWWAMHIRGKEDPNLKIGQVNDRAAKATDDYVWALRDIDFEVKQGEVLGIIGKNGAGKSTLLKILSRVTTPTTGCITAYGRIASLLEVGTGFHPEMTGRENIYMNGSIMGMNKAEIKRKLDEIVDFAGIEKYIDTPVKRYSSGMTVRLGFAIAAHLEPEILVVDEVLAVGDAEFQKKAIGKMQDVSQGQGRTILFVSHNMAAVQNLCNRCVLLDNGSVDNIGEVEEVINSYLYINKTQEKKLSEIKTRKGNSILKFIEGKVKDIKTNIYNQVESFSDIQIKLTFEVDVSLKIKSSKIDIGINNSHGDRVAWLSTENVSHTIDIRNKVVFFQINNLPLAPGEYNCNLYCEINNEISDWLFNVLPFSIIEKDYYGSGKNVPVNQGNVLLKYTIC